MSECVQKFSLQTDNKDITHEQTIAPRRSLADSKTWLGLLDSVENVRCSTQTVFKVSGKYLNGNVHGLEPIFIYDNIILGRSGDRLVFLFGDKFEYVRNQLLSEAVNQESYCLAKSVFGTCIASYILDKLKEKYGKAFDVDEYCDLVQLTFNFELCDLNDAVNQWVCRFISGQAGLEEAPVELRTTNFQFWECNQCTKNVLKYQAKTDCLYSVGCFLENVLLS